MVPLLRVPMSTVSHVETKPTEFSTGWGKIRQLVFLFFLGVRIMHDHANHIPIQKYMFFATKRNHILDLSLTRDAIVSTARWWLTFLSTRESLYIKPTHLPLNRARKFRCKTYLWLEQKTLEELERIVFEWILEEGQSQGTPVWLMGVSYVFELFLDLREMIWNVPCDVARKGCLYCGLYCLLYMANIFTPSFN